MPLFDVFKKKNKKKNTDSKNDSKQSSNSNDSVSQGKDMSSELMNPPPSNIEKPKKPEENPRKKPSAAPGQGLVSQRKELSVAQPANKVSSRVTEEKPASKETIKPVPKEASKQIKLTSKEPEKKPNLPASKDGKPAKEKEASKEKSANPSNNKGERRVKTKNASVTRYAFDIRKDKEEKLEMEDLHWYGGGVFSNVYRGRLVSPEKMEIAIKKTWPKESVRSDEMIILAGMRRANPRNIIKLVYKFNNITEDCLCEAFIFEFMPETLDKKIKEGIDSIDIKMYTWQLFNGLDFLAANRIAHRDIKPINILINDETGELQIGDFGSAKVIQKRETSSAYQVTRYYRPPEMLLGSGLYDHMVDVWSGGCVFGEMIKGRVLFRGGDSTHQMNLIQAAFGSPTQSDLDAMKLPEKYPRVRPVVKQGIYILLRVQKDEDESFKPKPEMAEAVEVLKRILAYNPTKRLCGPALLEDPFFADVLASTKLRKFNKKPTCTNLIRQSDDTMHKDVFPKSHRSAKAPKISVAPSKPKQPPTAPLPESAEEIKERSNE